MLNFNSQQIKKQNEILEILSDFNSYIKNDPLMANG